MSKPLVVSIPHRLGALRDEGLLPPGVEDADVYRGARSGYLVSDDKTSWQDLYVRQLSASLRPA